MENKDDQLDHIKPDDATEFLKKIVRPEDVYAVLACFWAELANLIGDIFEKELHPSLSNNSIHIITRMANFMKKYVDKDFRILEIV